MNVVDINNYYIPLSSRRLLAPEVRRDSRRWRQHRVDLYDSTPRSQAGTADDTRTPLTSVFYRSRCEINDDRSS